jgi:hypothetical protein
MEFRQANSPNDLPAVRTIHVRSAFQVRTVQAYLKAKLALRAGQPAALLTQEESSYSFC